MGQFNGGMNELMRQAARMQRKIEQVKKECGDKEVSAGAVGDKVKATVTLAGKVSRIDIDPEFLKTEGAVKGNVDKLVPFRSWCSDRKFVPEEKCVACQILLLDLAQETVRPTL